MFWNKYPYTDFHELNLDWILARMMELHKEWDEFTAVNKITNAGAWDITKQYQAWTVVSDNNAGYISLQPVPAGVAISNTEYWGLIADYDILITDLSNRIAALESQLSLLTNKRIIFVGDSYGSLAANWINDTIIMLGLSVGVNAFKVAEGGTGFVGGDGVLTPDKTWKTLLQNNAASITDHDTITDIIVCGGCNDVGNAIPLLETYMADFFSYCHSTYPNAKIHVGMIGWMKSATGIDDLRLVNTYYMRASRISKYACYIENAHTRFHYTGWFVSGDNVHPDGTGMLAIANGIANYILNGTCPALTTGIENAPVTAPTPSGIFSDCINNLNTGKTAIVNGIPICHFYIFVSYSASKTITGSNSGQEIATLGFTHYFGGQNIINKITAMLVSYDTTPTIKEAQPVDLYIRGGKIMCNIPKSMTAKYFEISFTVSASADNC